MSLIFNFLRVSSSELNLYLDDSSLLEKRVYDHELEADPNIVDIDKAWEGVFYLLTGNNTEDIRHPLARVLFSGQLVDEIQELGYGPGNYLTPEQVKEVDRKISKITKDDLRKVFNPARMAEVGVYPEMWEEKGAFEFLAARFEIVQEVYSVAAKNNEAVITFLT